MQRQTTAIPSKNMIIVDVLHDIERPKKKQRLSEGITNVVSVLADIGSNNYSRGDYQAAEECFAQALSTINIDYVYEFSQIRLIDIDGSADTTTHTKSSSCNNTECCACHKQQEKGGQERTSITNETVAYGDIEFDEGMRVYQDLLQIDGAGSMEVAAAILFYNAGQTYVERRQLKKAKVCFHKSLELFSTQLQGSRVVINKISTYKLMNLHCLGYCHYRTGSEDKANTFYQRALAIASSELCTAGPGKYYMAAAANCIGIILFNEDTTVGNTDMAMDMFMKSLSLHKACIEPDVVSIATVLNNMGRVYYLQSEYIEAHRVYAECLQLRKVILGNESVDVAATAYNLGQTCYQLGQIDEALSHFHLFLSIMLAGSSCCSFSKDIALVYKAIGDIYQDKSDYKMALHYLQKMLEIQKARADGIPSSDVAATLNKMGNLWYELKDYNSAMEYYQEGLAVEKAILEPDHHHIIVTTTNIGHIFKQLGDFGKALIEYKTVYRLQCKKLGNNHFLLADTMSSIGLMQYHLKNYEASFDSYQEALRVRRQHLGNDEYPEIASTLNSIGLVLFKQHIFELAKKCFTESLRIRSKLLGKNHRDVAILWYNIATIHFETGEDELAIQMYEETLRVEKHSLGKDHPDVLTTLQHLGQVHHQLGNSEKAIEYFREALDTERRRLQQSADCRSQARILNLLGNVYLQLGRTMDMMECYVEAARIYESNRASGETLVIGGYNFYALSKTNPQCAAAA